MNERYTYLLIDLASVILPFAFSFHPVTGFGKSLKKAFLSIFIPAILFVPWDILFTRAGIWSFNKSKTMGQDILGLPVEEVLFFLCIPYACVFTYNALSKLDLKAPWKILSFATPVILTALTILAVYNSGRLYTSVTSFLTAALIFYHYYIIRSQWFGRFILSYLVLLIPFIIVNGLLTGSFGNAAIVLYNNEFNLGIRVLNIPVEDFLYGFCLILLTIATFESKLLLNEKKDPGLSL